MGQQSYERVWRARQMWAGLSLVYAKACILALRGGPHRKPEYVVTRKHDEFAWYWRETLPHTVLPAPAARDAGLQPGDHVPGEQLRCGVGLLGPFLRDPDRRVREEELVRGRPAALAGRPGRGAPEARRAPGPAHGGRFDRTRAPASTHIGVD